MAKGANQAVAAARLGARVAIIGRVGPDTFGQELKTRFTRKSIDTRWLSESDDVPTGIAAITVWRADNAIVLVRGANAALGPTDLDAAEAAFSETDVVLAQLEVPLATVQHAAELAARHGKPFILNPAPAIELPDSLSCALHSYHPKRVRGRNSPRVPSRTRAEPACASTRASGPYQGRSGLNLLGVSAFYQEIIKGSVILLAVLLDRSHKTE